MGNYIQLSAEIQEKIRKDKEAHKENPYAFRDEQVVRRNEGHDTASLWRPAFVRDCEKIMHLPYYNRYGDKTQVFSLYRNDDITRRLVHVQLVSRIARNIGQVLGLNLDLIEAISLGHDIGHTPFGHSGERKLDELYYAGTGRHFAHNIQSARVLDTIFPVNLSLQTLDGIICHNGEMELEKYEPSAYWSFAELDQKMEDCYLDLAACKMLVPATLEACVMRVSDIIAYLGKDRQDAVKLGRLPDDRAFSGSGMGKINAEIIHNMTVNIIERSYGKPYLKMDPEFFEAFSMGKRENYEKIYLQDANTKIFQEQIYPMFEAVYEKLLEDMKKHDRNSVIYKHHIEYIKGYTKYYSRKLDYEAQEPNAIVVDYIASMTDDYFVDLYGYLFPKGKYHVEYQGYFE
ncbi:MAG: HD domain-containing protein [Lachnospiraceae bacterium]|nr:HD domain-containing protein [Lachnospiraceae bacterium]